MLHIVICEDVEQNRLHYERIVKNYLSSSKTDAALVLVAAHPDEVVSYCALHPNAKTLFFLDVDLNAPMNGIDLAVSIKQSGHHAKVVFITTHSEMAFLIFQHKIDAMDYIIKDSLQDVKSRLAECIEDANHQLLTTSEIEPQIYVIKTGGDVWNIAYDDILFFETHPAVRHKIILHMEHSQIEYRGMIGELDDLSEQFYRCHQSYVVNVKKIARVNKREKTIEMTNGESIPITVRKITELTEMLYQQ